MQQVVEHATRWDPSFPGRIVPASGEDLDELESLVGHALPDEWLDFQLTMGASTPLCEGGDFRISHVLERYRELRAAKSRQLDERLERYLYIGANDTGWGVYDHYHLDLSTTPALVFQSETVTDLEHGCAEDGQYTAASLLELLLGSAFRILRLARLPHYSGFVPLGRQGWLREHPGHSHHLERVASRLGFEAVHPEHVIQRCFERDDAALMSFQPPGISTYYSLAATTEAAQAAIAKALCDELRLVPAPGSRRG